MNSPSFVDPLSTPTAASSEMWVDAGGGVRLRVLSWQPEVTGGRPIVFVAGLVSAIDGWIPVLEELVRTHPVSYIETREKNSAIIPKSEMCTTRFSVPVLADDLCAVVEELDLEVADSIFIGSSLGANTILESAKRGRLRCSAAFLISPNIEFSFPWWGHLLTRFPAASFHLFKYVILWYLRNFRVNAREDPRQMARYANTIRVAHPQRIKLLGRRLPDYSIWPEIDTVAIPVTLAYAANDTLHGQSEAESIAERLPTATTIACPSNTFMHEAAIVPIIHEHDGLQNIPDLHGDGGDSN